MIEEITEEQFNKLTDDEQDEYLALLHQELIEKVSPKLEAFRDPIIGGNCDPKYRVRGARGGRGSLAKSHSLVSLIVQRANVEPIDVACFREIQDSIKDSVKKLIEEKVEFLGYDGWTFLESTVEGPEVNGKRSHFIFKGLKDLRASRNIKSLEAYDIFFIEECASVSLESLNLLLPTLIRHDGAQFWFCYNPETENDAISTKIWNANREDALLIEGRPGRLDNPWFNDAMVAEMERDKKLDYDEYLHTWEGRPRSQADKAILSRVDIHKAMEREILEPEGAIYIGCDPARFGDDRTVIFKRKGMKVIDFKIGRKWRTTRTADEIWSMANHDPTVNIAVDVTGIGAGVCDKLKELGVARLSEVNFGGASRQPNKYTSKADDLWFDFKDIINEVDIPNNNDLLAELSSRLYDFDKKGRRMVESKAKYKERNNGVSPDLADALLLCYNGNKGNEVNLDIQEQMRKRRGL